MIFSISQLVLTLQRIRPDPSCLGSLGLIYRDFCWFFSISYTIWMAAGLEG